MEGAVLKTLDIDTSRRWRTTWVCRCEALRELRRPRSHGTRQVWFHRPSATLIVTDLLQWMAGDLAWSTRAYATLTGVRRQLAVPLTVRALVRDRRAAARSAERVLRWPFERVVMAHNQVVDTEAYAQVTPAFAML